MTDKYEDPNYGNTFKTSNSVFTVREIEMMCREMEWNHIENYFKKYDDQKPPYWLCRMGSGYFHDRLGNEYLTYGTSRTSWWEILPSRTDYKERKEELRKWLISKEPTGAIYRWYANPENREYYLYDVVLENPWVHDSKELAKLLKNKPEENHPESDGQKHYYLVLFHMAVGKTDRTAWGRK